MNATAAAIRCCRSRLLLLLIGQPQTHSHVYNQGSRFVHEQIFQTHVSVTNSGGLQIFNALLLWRWLRCDVSGGTLW